MKERFRGWAPRGLTASRCFAGRAARRGFSSSLSGVVVFGLGAREDSLERLRQFSRAGVDSTRACALAHDDSHYILRCRPYGARVFFWGLPRAYARGYPMSPPAAAGLLAPSAPGYWHRRLHSGQAVPLHDSPSEKRGA